MTTDQKLRIREAHRRGIAEGLSAIWRVGAPVAPAPVRVKIISGSLKGDSAALCRDAERLLHGNT